MSIYRVIDANINRVSEGIRVLEDIARFIINDAGAAESLRKLRHSVRKGFQTEELIRFRNSREDVGLDISQSTNCDTKENLQALVKANFKRVQEGIRSIEECLKIIGCNPESKTYEGLRFCAYDLEKNYSLKSFMLDTDIYGITGEEFSKGKNTIAVVKEMMDAGIKVIQYREKNKTKLQKYNECVAIRRLTQEKGVTFIVNDDLDIAITVKADGIHIGQDDIPIEEVKKLSGSMIVGLSTHNPEQALHAVTMGADYIGVGPIFHTTSKKNPEHSDGLEYMKWVSENIKLPHVAIGGINELNIKEVKEAGGKCFAMISELVAVPDMADKVRSIRALLNNKSL